MSFIADILLIAGALGAAFYCVVLSRKLNRLNDLEDGVGGAISGLSSQVSDMTRALDRARSEALTSSQTLDESTQRAEAAARKLELLMASMHDLPEPDTAEAAETPNQPMPLFQRAGRSAPKEAAE